MNNIKIHNQINITYNCGSALELPMDPTEASCGILASIVATQFFKGDRLEDEPRFFKWRIIPVKLEDHPSWFGS